jgi:V8-like Glu-specific endopeptidase
MKSDRDKPAKYNEGCLYDYAVLVLDTEDNLEEYFGSFGYDFDW